jgi:hypothetical protein
MSSSHASGCSQTLLSPQRKRINLIPPAKEGAQPQKKQKKMNLLLEAAALENEKQWATSSPSSSVLTSLALSAFEELWETSRARQGDDDELNLRHALLEFLPFLEAAAAARAGAAARESTRYPENFEERHAALVKLSQGMPTCCDSSLSRLQLQRLHLVEALGLETTETAVQTTDIEVKPHTGGTWQMILTFHPGLSKPLMLLSCECKCSLGTEILYEKKHLLDKSVEDKMSEARLCLNDIPRPANTDTADGLCVEGEWRWAVIGGSGGEFTTPFAYALEKQAPERMHWKTPRSTRRGM